MLNIYYLKLNKTIYKARELFTHIQFLGIIFCWALNTQWMVSIDAYGCDLSIQLRDELNYKKLMTFFRSSKQQKLN